MIKNISQRLLGSLLTLTLLAPLFTGCGNSEKRMPQHLELNGGMLMLDSTRFTVVSAELSYARQPKEYWERRLKQVKLSGANTVMVRVPWMLHEPSEGKFDFSSGNDVREFCRLAADNGLLVWLHVGPYVDAHMDMGGMPWWLLRDADMELRSLNKPFMDRVGRYFRVLAGELADMQLSRGGTIALLQIEEPVTGDTGSGIRAYLAALCDSVAAAGFDDVQLTLSATKDGAFHLPRNNAVTTMLINDGDNAMRSFSGIKKIDADAPIICYDVSRTCAHVWGVSPLKRNLNKTFLRLFEVMENNGSLNTSVLVGGTSYGHIAGATVQDGIYRPYSTSYDNGAVINECGRPWKDSYIRFGDAFRRVASLYGKGVDEIPETSDLITVAPMRMNEGVSLFASLPEPLLSDRPLSFEHCGMGFGAVLYETTLPETTQGAALLLNGVHDNAQIFVDGNRVASVGRVDSVVSVALPASAAGGVLRILVDAMGRAGDITGGKDLKGLVGDVSLHSVGGNVEQLTGWKNYPLPAEYDWLSSKSFTTAMPHSVPACYRATFKPSSEGDTFLYMASWGRGEVWVNGHSLGRYWNIGPQQTLYLPGCWLHDGDNEIVILEWVGTDTPVIEGLDNALLE